MKKVLVVVDMQNDFITGSLGNDESRAVVPHVVNEVKRCIEECYDIVFTMDSHGKNYLDTREGKDLPVPHCILGTLGEEIIPELEIYKFSFFRKQTFGSIALAESLAKANYDEIELIGVCTDICVVSNAILIKSFSPETEVKVKESCCAGVTPQGHKAAIETMKMCQINVI
jgi:nicotinamidase-related amidase